ALDVVPVRVAEEDVATDRPVAGAGQLAPELADAGAAIEDQQLASGGAHLDAGRIAAIAHRGPAGRRDGAPGAPEADLHAPTLLPTVDPARGAKLLEDPAIGGALVAHQLLRAEPERDLGRGGVGRVRGVDQVPADLERPIAANSARRGVHRVGGAH